MAQIGVPPAIDELVTKVTAVPGVVAVALGGSRATGSARDDSDWDLGAYYRASGRPLNPDDVRALGYPGEVSELGAWGPIVNGGAWLTLDGIAVDLLFRDLDLVEQWLADARAGRFEVLDQHGCLVGAPTYGPVGELALGRTLTGQLPRATYSDALSTSASSYWHGRARVSLMFAGIYSHNAEHVCCVGMLVSAILCVAHSRLAARREWVLNEKRLVQRAGLGQAAQIMSGASRRPSPTELAAMVTQVGAAIGAEPLQPR